MYENQSKKQQLHKDDYPVAENKEMLGMCALIQSVSQKMEHNFNLISFVLIFKYIKNLNVRKKK